MPIPDKYLADFEEGEIFHVYNRTNNHEHLFLNDDNRQYFLRRYTELLSSFLDTFSWSLLPNHFHFLVRVKPKTAILSFLQNLKNDQLTITEKKFIENQISLSQLIEHEFRRFFQSYALAFNKTHQRSGNLFYKPFKRVKIEKEAHFTMAIIYIHSNALKHGIVKDFTKYRWSSWNSIISNQPTLLARQEVIEWFGNINNLIKVHKEMSRYYFDCAIAIE